METYIINLTTLEKSKYGVNSIFENMFVFETINPEKLFNIIHTADLITFNNKRYVDGIGSLYKTERDLLMAYKYQWVSVFDTFISEWYLPTHGWGRIYPKEYLSMSVFHRPTRHTLCNDYLIDLDLVNCHYEIVLDYLKKLNLPYEHIEKYCNNVAYYRQHISEYYNVSKDTAKQLFIRLIYGGSINGWLKDNNIQTHTILDFVSNVADEIEELIDIVWEGNQHIYNDIVNSNNKYFYGKTLRQKQRTIMSFWCQSIERYIQEQCIVYIRDTYKCELKYFIPCQDGFMMRKIDFNLEYVDDINNFISTMLDKPSKFIVKPFNEKYRINTPSIEHIYKPFDLLNAEDAQFAQYLIDVGFKYNEIISIGKDKFFEAYQYNGVFWEALPIHNAEFHKGRLDYLQSWCEKKALLVLKIYNTHCTTFMPELTTGMNLDNLEIKETIKTLSKELTKLTNNRESTEEQITYKKKQLRGFKLMSEIVKTLEKINGHIKNLSKNSLRKNIIEIFLSKLHKSNIEWDKNPELFAFNNCIINLSTGEFVQPHKDQYIRTTCGWEWNNEYSPVFVSTIREIINSILPIQSVQDYYLMYQSTGLSGNKIQKVLINTGVGGNGKGVLRGLDDATKGNYSMKIPTDILCHSIKGDGANPILANMNEKRSIYFSEPNPNQRLCSATLKEISGDGSISARGLYSAKTNINITATISGDCNKIPLFDQIDSSSANSLIRRLVVCPFITRAVSQEEYDLTIDKTYLNIKQSFAEDTVWINNHKQAYFIILLEHYQRFKNTVNALDIIPEECKNRALAHLTLSCDIMNWFMDYMEKDDNFETSKAIPLKHLYEQFKNHEVFKTFSKKDQRKYNQKYFIDQLENSKSLTKYIKCRDKYHNFQQLKTICLVGYKYVNDVNNIEDIEDM